MIQDSEPLDEAPVALLRGHCYHLTLPFPGVTATALGVVAGLAAVAAGTGEDSKLGKGTVTGLMLGGGACLGVVAAGGVLFSLDLGLNGSDNSSMPAGHGRRCVEQSNGSCYQARRLEANL